MAHYGLFLVFSVRNILRHATLQIFDSLSFIIVPPEVLKRDPVAIEVYNNALEGKSILKRMSLMLIRQAED